jgi:hypothetical protein
VPAFAASLRGRPGLPMDLMRRTAQRLAVGVRLLYFKLQFLEFPWSWCGSTGDAIWMGYEH